MFSTRRTFIRHSVAAVIAVRTKSQPLVEHPAWRLSSSSTSTQTSYGAAIYLDHNENAYGPSARVEAALNLSFRTKSNRYPREQYDDLRSRLARFHAVGKDQVLLGCGSSEILQMAAATLISAGRKGCLIQASPTYLAIGEHARAIGANVIEIPLTKTYGHDLDQMLKTAAKETSPGLIYICNPNNPTGTLTDRFEIENIVTKLPQNFFVLIDEAYCHFVSPHSAYASFLDKPLNDPRVLVCRTFSKVYGLAGMRVGYAVGQPDMLKRLEATCLRYGVATPSSIAALAALEDSDYIGAAIARNADARQEFMNQTNIRMLRAINSHANFVMLDPLRSAKMVIEHLKNHRVFVMPVVPPMDRYIRVSLGTPDDMREFWRAMDLLPPTGKMAM